MGPRPRGRGVSSLESRLAVKWWLQWGRARAGAEFPPSPPRVPGLRSGFNGAAPARARSSPFQVRIQPALGASMGPRPRGRGVHVGHLSNLLSLMLQWGRARAGAEFRHHQWLHRRGDASMGPRPRGRGVLLAHLAPRHPPVASMGPRPRGRGVLDFTGTIVSTPWLQWGRARAGAELPGRARQGNPTGRFNGAAPARARSCHERGGAGAEGRASMGPRPRGRGVRAVPMRIVNPFYASMGPRPRGRGVCVAAARGATPR